MAPKRLQQEETTEQRKTKLAAKREKVRLGVSNLRQRRLVEESPEQRETRLAAQRESTKLRLSN